MEALGDGNTCAIELDSCTAVTECVAEGASCVRGNGAVLECCDEGYACIRGKHEADSAALCKKDRGIRSQVVLPQTCDNVEH